MNNSIGTPFTEGARRLLLCGAGELGKEVVIELQRYGVEVIAVDAYADAPAMQVADRAHVISMLDGDALRGVIEKERPHLVVPEVEAIATDVLAEIEAEGVVEIIPTARATQLTMNREGIRRRRESGTVGALFTSGISKLAVVVISTSDRVKSVYPFC